MGVSGSKRSRPTRAPVAGSKTTQLVRAAFIDRDGTLNPDLHYLSDPDRLELYRGVPEGIALLHEHGYRVICITNQSGVERGLYTHEDVARIHARLNELLGRSGTAIDAFYYCPHVPESHCTCRKPGTELFERAARDWSIHLPASAVIGDRGLDVEAGDRLGLLTVLVPQIGHEIETAVEMRERKLTASFTAPSFRAGVQQLLYCG